MRMRYEGENGTEGWAEENPEKQGAGNEYTIQWEDEEDSAAREPRRKRGFRLTGSMGAKIAAFFLLAASCLVGLGAGLMCLYMESRGFYTKNLDSVLMDIMSPLCHSFAYTAESYIEQGNMSAVAELCSESNFDMTLIHVENDAGETILWSSENERETELATEIYFVYEKKEKTVRINGYTLEDGEWYILRICLDPDFPQEDDFRTMAGRAEYWYGIRYILIAVSAVSFFLCLICFLFLMCSAGHRNGRKGIVPGALSTIHLDVLTVLFVGGAKVFVFYMVEKIPYVNDRVQLVLLTLGGTVLVVWLTFYCMDFALRVKRGRCWRYSLVYVTLRQIGRILRFLGRELAGLVGELPLVMTTLTVYLGICILEFIGVILFINSSEGVVLWGMEKEVLLFAVLYIALMCRKLLKASRKLADGEENYRVDTSRMFGAFREHGEYLNSLGLGISKAVEARTRSERMKTELISNVSHDLKTPLTSIVNYADLIWEEANSEGNASGDQPADSRVSGEWKPIDTHSGQDALTGTDTGEQMLQASAGNGKIKEYAEVLLRQSRRLKKLLEDLVEASKATTGNLEVNLEPCEVGVLLSQAAGEYQQRMEEKHLELIIRQSEEAVTILADGRRLWRIFENLLNNICKYAQENSRVYLNVEAKEKEVRIIFRNMSKYPLDISAEELEERFVRGDKSRHMEGNGLGLSIAKSLAELQNGRMEIVTDGDLFKVALCFRQYFGE